MSAHLLAIPLHPAHAASLSLRPGAVQALAGMAPLPQLARAYHAAGPAWTVLDGDTPIACGGVVRFWPGVGECWCWVGTGVDAVPVAFARLARRIVGALVREHRFHRLQLHARLDDVRANRFATHLGFTLEGRCPGFGSTQSGQATYNLYGRFRTWKE